MSSYIGHFSLWGDFEPEDITSILNLEPTDTRLKGTLWEGAEHLSRSADWDLHCPEDLSMKEQVEFLLNVLWSRADVLRPLAEQFNADLNISGEGTEVMDLKADTLQKLAQLHVNLNCFFHEQSENAD